MFKYLIDGKTLMTGYESFFFVKSEMVNNESVESQIDLF